MSPQLDRYLVSLTIILTKFAAASACLVVSEIAYPQQAIAQVDSLDKTDSLQIPRTIVLKKFDIVGNRAIDPAELDRLLQPYLFRPIGFAELLEVQQAITQLLVARGYFTSGAYIPPQKIENRTVRIEIIEGSLEEIKISGLKHLRSEYIRQRIEAATEPPLNRQKLLDALLLLQLNPRIANISAELSQGIEPGTSLLEIEVEEANTFNTELTFDNERAVSVGSQGRQLSLADDNVLGFGDRFAVAYLNTPSSDSVSNLSYTFPLSAKNNELGIVYSYSNSQIVNEPFQDLGLSSRSTYVAAKYRHLLLQTPKQEVALDFAFSHQDTQLFLQGDGFPDLDRGTDLAGITKISALRITQEYSERSEDRVFALSSQFNLGVDVFDATTNPDDIPDSQFFVWRLQAQYLKQIMPQTNLFLRGEVQLADRALVSLEQFRSGGASSVRGYRRDRTLGDNGLFLSAELRNTIWRTPQDNINLELNPFFDFGRVWNSDDLALEINTLASLGVGLQFSIRDTLVARVDWGIPLLEDRGFQSNSLQDKGIHFSLQLEPF